MRQLRAASKAEVRWTLHSLWVAWASAARYERLARLASLAGNALEAQAARLVLVAWRRFVDVSRRGSAVGEAGLLRAALAGALAHRAFHDWRDGVRVLRGIIPPPEIARAGHRPRIGKAPVVHQPGREGYVASGGRSELSEGTAADFRLLRVCTAAWCFLALEAGQLVIGLLAPPRRGREELAAPRPRRRARWLCFAAARSAASLVAKTRAALEMKALLQAWRLAVLAAASVRGKAGAGAGGAATGPGAAEGLRAKRRLPLPGNTRALLRSWARLAAASGRAARQRAVNFLFQQRAGAGAGAGLLVRRAAFMAWRGLSGASAKATPGAAVLHWFEKQLARNDADEAAEMHLQLLQVMLRAWAVEGERAREELRLAALQEVVDGLAAARLRALKLLVRTKGPGVAVGTGASLGAGARSKRA